MKDLVLTLIGPDRPGLVESLAKRVADHGGNWLESRMAHLAGQFAGILRVEVPPDKIDALQRALGELEAEGLRVVAQDGGSEPRPGRDWNEASREVSRKLPLSAPGPRRGRGPRSRSGSAPRGAWRGWVPGR